MSFARQSLGSLATLLFGLAVSIVLPRVLGAEARGEYQLAVKVAALVLAVAQWGIPEVLLQVTGDRRHNPGQLFGTSLALCLAGTLVLAVVLTLSAPALEGGLLRGVDRQLVWLALLGSFASIVALLARRFIQLDGRLGAFNGLEIGRTILFLCLVLIAGAVLVRDALGPTLAWLIAELVLALVALAYVARMLGPPNRWTFSTSVAKKLVVSGAPIQVGLLAMFIGSEGGAFVLNATFDIAIVGIYAVALSISRLVLQVSGALRTTLQPRLVEANVDAAQVTSRVTRHGLLWMILVALGLALGSPLVPLVFTDEFAPAAQALLLLLPGMVAYGVWQLVASHLLRVGRRGLLAAVAWLFAVASIGLQAVGGQALGLSGAAAGLSLAYLLAAGVIVVAFVRHSGLPARELVPAVSDLSYYAGLTRRALATLG